MNMSKLIVATVCALSLNVAMAGPKSCASATMGYKTCKVAQAQVIAEKNCKDVSTEDGAQESCRTAIRSMCDAQKNKMQDACKGKQKN
ncbi:MAG: hypothetical protein EBY16_02255 [Gammaproteobacteria bacterium]|nr:hypothetical protein [Gammaproteobacteria bacterium]